MTMTANQLRVDAALRAFLASPSIAVGDRLPPFPDMARRIGTSVSVLQMVMPRLVGEGLLEVEPRVGTFLRQRPEVPADAPHAGTRLRFFIGEESSTTSMAWRKVVERFEELHPGVCVDLSLTDTNDPLLRRPDLLLLESRSAAERTLAGGFLPWADERIWQPDRRTAIALAVAGQHSWATALPVLVGTQVLLARRGGSTPDPTSLAGLLATSAEGDDFGLVITSAISPLWAWGLGAGGVQGDDERVHEYLTMLAEVPAPRLAVPCDFVDRRPLTLLAPLVGRRCRYCLSSLWVARFAERGAWDVLPPPGDGPIECGAMCLLVPVGAQAEAAGALARFIAGEEGQRLLAGSEALLPTWAPALQDHPLGRLDAAVNVRGWPPSCLFPDPGWTARRRLADVALEGLRVHRTDPAAVIAALVAVDCPPGVDLSVVC